MDKKTLLTTLGAAVVVGGIGVSMYQSQQGSRSMDSPLILPDLASAAAKLDHIKIETAGKTLVVQSHKEADKWVIDNLGNYTADTKALSTLINNLKDARKVEAKTAKPELFHHLGLKDIADEQSKAALVSVSGGGQSYQLLIGDAAKNGSGQYVRLAGENQTYLVDKSFDKPDKAEDWINTKLFDFTLQDIQNVSLSGQFEYRLNKADKEQQNFTLTPFDHETHKLKYEAIVDSLPRAVTNLKFEALKTAAEYQQIKVEDDTPVSHLSVKLFDNEQAISLELKKTADAFFVKLQGDNPLWQDWAYQISEYNYNQLVKDKMDFLEEVKPAVAESVKEEPAAQDNEG